MSKSALNFRTRVSHKHSKQKIVLEYSFTWPFHKKCPVSNYSSVLPGGGRLGEERLFEARNWESTFGACGLTGTSLFCDGIPFIDDVAVATIFVPKSTFLHDDCNS